ncbi:MAG TPA: hypothetical protein PK402_04285, partial [Tepidisphaeraceae bacterium]|nr:hypothetical protein [Tepidisphaeraceae bacterium]
MASAQSIPPLSRLPDVPRPLANGDLLKFNFSTSSFGTVNEAAFALVADLGTASAYDVGTSAGEIPALGVGGKLLTSVLPALAITSRYVVASQAAMLALTAEEGDVAIRTDLSKSFILGTGSPTILGSWSEL